MNINHMKSPKMVAAVITSISLVAVMVIALPSPVFAAVTPSLGAAASYGVLSSTYTNTSAATSITGDVGFTTPPATPPAGVHANYGSDAPYAAAGADQATAKAALDGQGCTYPFAPGAIDLATDAAHPGGPMGVYTPGVYCVDGAMSVGTAGITLLGSGTYIFRSTGALDTTAGSVVTLSGASARNVFWTPAGATTLGATTTFKGTVIGAPGITIGADTGWDGRALAFGYTVTTGAADTIVGISVPVPAAPSAPDLDSGDDLGNSDTDDITSQTSALTFTGTSEAGATLVQLYNGGDLIATDPAPNGAGDWTIDVSLGEGTHNLHAIAWNETGVSDESPVTVVTIDATAPMVTSARISGSNEVTVTFDGDVYSTSDAFTDFTVTGDTERVISFGGVSGSDTNVFTFDGDPVPPGGAGTVDIGSTPGSVMDLAGNDLVSLDDYSVTDPATVYVDDDWDSNANAGGHVWNYDAFDNIPDAIDAVTEGGTVNVASGSYVDTDTLTIDKELDLLGPGIDVAPGDEAYIENDSCSYAISVSASDVYVSGFYVSETDGGDDPCYSYPVIRVIGDEDEENPITGVTITENDIAYGYRGVNLRYDTAGTTVSYNRIHDGEVGVAISGSEGNAVTNNEIYDNVTGLELREDGGGCTICDNDLGNTSVNNNDIHDNSDYGVYVNSADPALDTSGVTFEINKIHGNGTGMATDELEEPFDARNNWWGDETGPDHFDSNPDGLGNEVMGSVLYRPFYTDDDFTTLSTAEVDPEDLESLFTSGTFILPDGEITTAISEIEVAEDLTITVGDSSVEIPSGTTITRTGGGTFDGTMLTSEEVDETSLTGLGSGVVAEGAMEWGADVGLTFDPAITLNIFVGADLNGQTLNVKRSPDGGTTWTSDGIEPPATCVVAGGICSFEATKASIYVSTTGGGGGSGGGGYWAGFSQAFSPTTIPGRGDPANLGRYGLHEGDVTGGEGDPDVYIVNAWGYKRLFLNPAIFNFYGHLGGFSKVKHIAGVGRDAFPTSGLFRNCEANDQEVYAVEVTGEDSGTLHHVQISGDAAVAQDADFFKKVFCINNNEFNWYPKSPTPYTSLSQVPVYSRPIRVLGF